MSSTQHYKSNLRDIFFNLYEFFKVQDFALGKGPFKDMDLETSKEIVTAFEAMCTNEFSQTFVESDRVPLRRSAVKLERGDSEHSTTLR